MRFLFLWLCFGSGAAMAEVPSKMDFTYEPVEGEAATSCKFAQIRDLPDYEVACATPFGLKIFKAHVVVREYVNGGRGSVEILYWVTEPGAKPVFHSTSAIFHFKGAAPLTDFSLSQGVENDLASLVLGWGSGKR